MPKRKSRGLATTIKAALPYVLPNVLPMVIVVAVLALIAVFIARDDSGCLSARDYTQAFDVCVIASPGSAFCSVSVEDIRKYRDSQYRLATKRCKALFEGR